MLDLRIETVGVSDACIGCRVSAQKPTGKTNGLLGTLNESRRANYRNRKSDRERDRAGCFESSNGKMQTGNKAVTKPPVSKRRRATTPVDLKGRSLAD
jgi:hypothetical protein